MTTSARRSGATHRIAGPDELLQAIPYLLGFHPRDSLVLVGLDDYQLVVTARLDLADPQVGAIVCDTIEALRRGGACDVVAAVFCDDRAAGGRGPTFEAELFGTVIMASDHAGCGLLGMLVCSGDRWWSTGCDSPDCCPPDGRILPDTPSVFAAESIVDGVVALPDRAALEAMFEPTPEAAGDDVARWLAQAEDDAMAAVLGGRAVRHERSLTRAILAAGRESEQPGWVPPPGPRLATFAVAMTATALRDALWLAIDDGRFDGRPLLREIARQCPPPYTAAPLFLFGWAAWRSGGGALAGIAAERAVAADSDYHAAELLLAALSHGTDPRQFPKLRLAPR